MQTNDVLTLQTQEVTAGFNPVMLEKAKASLTDKAEVLPVNLSMKNWATDKITEFKRAVFLGIEKMNCLNEKTGEIEGRDAAIFMNEKSIIREDYEDSDKFTKRYVVSNQNKQSGDRACNIIQSIEIGMNEKSIIRERRDHYDTIHDTQKPVALIERLMRLCGVCGGKNTLDPFSGSASSGIAAMNLGATWIGIEMELVNYTPALERLKKYIQEREYMLF